MYYFCLVKVQGVKPLIVKTGKLVQFQDLNDYRPALVGEEGFLLECQ